MRIGICGKSNAFIKSFAPFCKAIFRRINFRNDGFSTRTELFQGLTSQAASPEYRQCTKMLHNNKRVGFPIENQPNKDVVFQKQAKMIVTARKNPALRVVLPLFVERKVHAIQRHRLFEHVPVARIQPLEGHDGRRHFSHFGVIMARLRGHANMMHLESVQFQNACGRELNAQGTFCPPHTPLLLSVRTYSASILFGYSREAGKYLPLSFLYKGPSADPSLFQSTRRSGIRAAPDGAPLSPSIGASHGFFGKESFTLAVVKTELFENTPSGGQSSPRSSRPLPAR